MQLKLTKKKQSSPVGISKKNFESVSEKPAEKRHKKNGSGPPHDDGVWQKDNIEIKGRTGAQRVSMCVLNNASFTCYITYILLLSAACSVYRIILAYCCGVSDIARRRAARG